MGILEIAEEDVPDGLTLTISTGQLLDVTDGTGILRHCKIASWINFGPLWQITVVDLTKGPDRIAASQEPGGEARK